MKITRNVGLAVILLWSAAAQGQLQYVEPPNLDFSTKVITEAESYSTTVALARNNQYQLTKLKSVDIINGHTNDFSLAQPPSYDVLPEYYRGHVDIGVVFHPTALGNRSAQLRIVTESPLSTRTVNLSGIGVAARVTPFAGVFNGIGPGESTVGAGGDYADIGAAFAAVTSKGSLSGGDWLFRLTDDQILSSSAYLGASLTHGNKMTFRPDTGSSPTITLTNGARLIIGRSAASESVPNRPTRDVTIDGSSISGQSNRNLSIVNNIEASAGGLIDVVGDCDRFALRNCTMRCFVADGSHSYFAVGLYADRSSYDMDYYGGGGPQVLPGDSPDSAFIENNSILVTGSEFPSAIAVQPHTHAPMYYLPALKYGCSNLTIRNNTIKSKGMGIYLFWFLSADVSDNDIEIQPDFSGVTQSVIPAIIADGARFESPPSNGIIHGNKIRFVSTETTHPLAGIKVSGSSVGSEFVISNNVITGLAAAVPGFDPSNRIALGNGSDAECTITVAHNSIDMRGGTSVSGAQVKTSVLSNLMYSSNQSYKGTMIFRNNIVRMDIANATVYNLKSDEKLIADNNDIFTNDKRVGVKGGLSYQTLADWQTATGNDLNSFVQDPYVAVASGGTWIGPSGADGADLHFSSDPGSLYRAQQIMGIWEDIDGDARPANTTIGADEVTINASVGSWMLY